jgi:hypothetical protein
MLAEQENTEMLRLLRLLCEHTGVPLDGVRGRAFEEETKHAEIVRQIRGRIEEESETKLNALPVGEGQADPNN